MGSLAVPQLCPFVVDCFGLSCAASSRALVIPSAVLTGHCPSWCSSFQVVSFHLFSVVVPFLPRGRDFSAFNAWSVYSLIFLTLCLLIPTSLHNIPSWWGHVFLLVACLVVYWRPDSAVLLLGARFGHMPLNCGGPCSNRLLGNLELSDPVQVVL